MSDTPRTDAEASKINWFRNDVPLVPADFARRLEREIVKLNHENHLLREAQKICVDCDAPTAAEFEALRRWMAEHPVVESSSTTPCIEAFRTTP